MSRESGSWACSDRVRDVFGRPVKIKLREANGDVRTVAKPVPSGFQHPRSQRLSSAAERTGAAYSWRRDMFRSSLMGKILDGPSIPCGTIPSRARSRLCRLPEMTYTVYCRGLTGDVPHNEPSAASIPFYAGETRLVRVPGESRRRPELSMLNTCILFPKRSWGAESGMGG